MAVRHVVDPLICCRDPHPVDLEVKARAVGGEHLQQAWRTDDPVILVKYLDVFADPFDDILRRCFDGVDGPDAYVTVTPRLLAEVIADGAAAAIYPVERPEHATVEHLTAIAEAATGPEDHTRPAAPWLGAPARGEIPVPHRPCGPLMYCVDEEAVDQLVRDLPGGEILGPRWRFDDPRILIVDRSAAHWPEVGSPASAFWFAQHRNKQVTVAPKMLTKVLGDWYTTPRSYRVTDEALTRPTALTLIGRAADSSIHRTGPVEFAAALLDAARAVAAGLPADELDAIFDVAAAIVDVEDPGDLDALAATALAATRLALAS